MLAPSRLGSGKSLAYPRLRLRTGWTFFPRYFNLFNPLELLKLIHNGVYEYLDAGGCFRSPVLVAETLYLKHHDIRTGFHVLRSLPKTDGCPEISDSVSLHPVTL